MLISSLRILEHQIQTKLNFLLYKSNTKPWLIKCLWSSQVKHTTQGYINELLNRLVVVDFRFISTSCSIMSSELKHEVVMKFLPAQCSWREMSSKQFYPFKDFSIRQNTDRLSQKIYCLLHMQECRFKFDWLQQLMTNGFIFQIINNINQWNPGEYAWLGLTVKKVQGIR